MISFKRSFAHFHKVQDQRSRRIFLKVHRHLQVCNLARDDPMILLSYLENYQTEGARMDAPSILIYITREHFKTNDEYA